MCRCLCVQVGEDVKLISMVNLWHCTAIKQVFFVLTINTPQAETGIVPEKSVNKTGNSAAELTEERPVTKGNSQRLDRIRIQNRKNTTSRMLAMQETAKGQKHQ